MIAAAVPVTSCHPMDPPTNRSPIVGAARRFFASATRCRVNVWLPIAFVIATVFSASSPAQARDDVAAVGLHPRALANSNAPSTELHRRHAVRVDRRFPWTSLLGEPVVVVLHDGTPFAGNFVAVDTDTLWLRDAAHGRTLDLPLGAVESVCLTATIISALRPYLHRVDPADGSACPALDSIVAVTGVTTPPTTSAAGKGSSMSQYAELRRELLAVDLEIHELGAQLRRYPKGGHYTAVAAGSTLIFGGGWLLAGEIFIGADCHDCRPFYAITSTLLIGGVATLIYGTIKLRRAKLAREPYQSRYDAARWHRRDLLRQLERLDERGS